MIDWTRPGWGVTDQIHASTTGSELDAEPMSEQ